MTLSFGGGAGVLTIPGVISDGLTPGGMDVAGNVQAATSSTTGAATAGSETIAGALTAGDLHAVGEPTFHTFYGSLRARETQGTIDDGDDVVQILQRTNLTADNPVIALTIQRNGALNGHQYTLPLLWVADQSGSTALLQQWTNNGVNVANLGHAGGLGLFGATPPAAPRTLAQATITAITDANAKAAVQACANALSDMGVLTLT